MALTQNIGRIDHIAYTVAPENLDSCVDRLTETLGLNFVRARRDDIGVLIATDWDAGFELLAPTGPESPLWERLQERGEGSCSLIFGISDMDKAKARAEGAGFSLMGPEIVLDGSEPWFDRFETLREQTLSPISGINVVLGEIKPRW